MRTSDLRTAVRNEIKNLGLGRKDVSVKVDVYSVTVQAKHEAVDLKQLQSTLSKFESYDRDEATGEILSGGNTFVFVRDITGRTKRW